MTKRGINIIMRAFSFLAWIGLAGLHVNLFLYLSFRFFLTKPTRPKIRWACITEFGTRFFLLFLGSVPVYLPHKNPWWLVDILHYSFTEHSLDYHRAITHTQPKNH